MENPILLGTFVRTSNLDNEAIEDIERSTYNKKNS
jgi:hypothetical protein